MNFDSPDVMEDFPGLYASEMNRQCSDNSDENDRAQKKDNLLIGKRKEKKDKERGYAALEGESSADENFKSRSPSKAKKSKSFKFSTKTKDKRDKSRDKDKDAEKKKDKDKKYEKKIDKERTKSEKVKKLKSTDDQSDIGDILPIFGVSLNIAVERSRCHDGVDIPLPIRQCIDHIETYGMSFEGLYKISGTKSKVLHIKKLYNQRENVNLSEHDIPTVTSLLKTFLRDLPDPLFTSDLLIRFEEAGAILSANTREKHLKILLENLPPLNRLLLSWLMVHLSNVSLSERCKMSKQSIAAALNHTFHCSSRLLSALLHHSHTLFSSVSIIKYLPPLESGAALPDNPSEIEDELAKQESLLNQIHSEMNVGCISKQREELLWEVQRIITQLKRKLKNVNKDREVVPEKKPPFTSTDIVDSSLPEDRKEVIVENPAQTVEAVHPKPCLVSNNKYVDSQEIVESQQKTTTCDTILESQNELSEELKAVTPSPLQVESRSCAEITDTAGITTNAATIVSTSIATNTTNSSTSSSSSNDVRTNAASSGGTVTTSQYTTNTELDKKLRLLQLKNSSLHQLKDSLWERIDAERMEISQLREQLSNEALNLPIVPEENLDELLGFILRENQLLQIKKVNLVRQIIEEEETCIELRAQLMLNA